MAFYKSWHETHHDGTSVMLPSDRGGLIGGAWAKGRFYETGMLEHIRKLNLTGAYVDVGMNVGNHSLHFAKVCPSDIVYAFEPYPIRCNRARMLFRKNDCAKKVNVFNIALGDRVAHITCDIRGKIQPAIMARLDDILPGPVSLMKIDVEGFEEGVLRGAERLIRESKPWLFIEIFDENWEHMSNYITSFGYKVGRRFKSPTYEFIPEGR